MNFCVGDVKHIKTTENKLDLECVLRTWWALFCISSQFPPCRFSILTAISKPCPPFMAFCEETSTVTPDFFFWYLHVLRTVQYKTYVKKKKSLIVEHDFLWKIVLYLVYLDQGKDFNLTTELSGKLQYSHNQAIKNGLNEAILLIWIKGALFST